MHGYRPPVYFWIAEYTNGTALPQFDPKTGKENKFSELNHSKLKRFGWYPFTKKMAQKIMKKEKLMVIPSKNPAYTITVERKDGLVAYRTNTIKMQTQKGGIDHGETVYILGVKGGKILQINEEGKAVDSSS